MSTILHYILANVKEKALSFFVLMSQMCQELVYRKQHPISLRDAAAMAPRAERRNFSLWHFPTVS